jgi:hypothetical protein
MDEGEAVWSARSRGGGGGHRQDSEFELVIYVYTSGRKRISPGGESPRTSITSQPNKGALGGSNNKQSGSRKCIVETCRSSLHSTEPALQRRGPAHPQGCHRDCLG